MDSLKFMLDPTHWPPSVWGDDKFKRICLKKWIVRSGNRGDYIFGSLFFDEQNKNRWGFMADGSAPAIIWGDQAMVEQIIKEGWKVD